MKVKNRQELKKEIKKAIVKHGNGVDLNYIDTSNVQFMNGMFSNAKMFNQPLKFDTSQVTDMYGMFYGAESFNQPLNFDTSKVKNMSFMFSRAKNFNQELNWDISNVKNIDKMFEGSKGKLINKIKKSKTLKFLDAVYSNVLETSGKEKDDIILIKKKFKEVILTNKNYKNKIASLTKSYNSLKRNNAFNLHEINSLKDRLSYANYFLKNNKIILFTKKQF